MLTRRRLLYSLNALPLALPAGCQPTPQTQAVNRPVPINDGDECHVCGMSIKRFPGPKGEVFVRGGAVHKFCSTRDLFAFLTQPENANIIRDIYVHDMAATAWDNPDDSVFTDARPAHYVIGHPLLGAMGPTLASFKTLPDARQFTQQHQARLLRFDDIEATMITNLQAFCPPVGRPPLLGA